MQKSYQCDIGPIGWSSITGLTHWTRIQVDRKQNNKIVKNKAIKLIKGGNGTDCCTIYSATICLGPHSQNKSLGIKTTTISLPFLCISFNLQNITNWKIKIEKNWEAKEFHSFLCFILNSLVRCLKNLITVKKLEQLKHGAQCESWVNSVQFRK